jgi:decaprenylphospho-beta-D-ribofuranose 2-oxidase
MQGRERTLTGFGLRAPSRARVLSPRGPEVAVTMLEHLAAAGSGVIARGAGLSYGDAAQNAGGAVLDMTGCDRVTRIDGGRGLVRVQAGTTLGELMAALSRVGLGLPVVPGTQYVTVAGAIAANVHGKSHHHDGAFERHVESIVLWTPAGGVLEISEQGEHSELFHATLGGMGLTGVVLEATLRTERLPSWKVSVHAERTASLDATLALLAAPERHRYSVAWLDLLARGPAFGRGIVERGDPLEEQATSPGSEPAYVRTRRPVLRRTVPVTPLRAPVVRALNSVRWRFSPRRIDGHSRPLDRFLFPLDAVDGWNRLYGSEGFIQYQLVIPDGREAALDGVFAMISDRRLPVLLAVLKRFGPASPGPLSFPLPGWTLAADIPAGTAGLGEALDELDEIAAASGGRVYLAKDVRMRAELLETMYPRLGRFREIAATADPAGLLRSDLSRRLAVRSGGR